MTMEVQVVFKTDLNETYQVADTPLSLPASSTPADLQDVLRALMSEMGDNQAKMAKKKQFSFLIEE